MSTFLLNLKEGWSVLNRRRPLYCYKRENAPKLDFLGGLEIMRRVLCRIMMIEEEKEEQNNKCG